MSAAESAVEVLARIDAALVGHKAEALAAMVDGALGERRLAAWDHLPHARCIDHVIEGAWLLCEEQAELLAAARGAARDAAWGAVRSAAWGAARSAAWDAARSAAWDAARDAAWDAARDAPGVADGTAGALVVADLVGHHGLTQSHIDTLVGPWRRVMGDPCQRAGCAEVIA